ncbi:unnamed protein product [Rangifer tarandus platyrhynchus]|uniref:Uncharacterized protein n=2 Tax=Rangifer tarandus platyrhynchus TaxID=3082113 RepID=A0ABN8ZHD5_RANTA|nr:unnamed protein product [Rangifer tarandus platyrhynchus]
MLFPSKVSFTGYVHYRESRLIFWGPLLSLPHMLFTEALWELPGGSDGKELPAMQETQVRSLGLEDPLEKGTATHSSILIWKNPRDRGAWQTTVHGVTQSWTRLSD